MDKTRLFVLCHIILAITDVASGNPLSALSVISAAYASKCCSETKRSVFYILAAIANISKARVFGISGYLFSAAGQTDIASPLLALHYGLIGIDGEELSIAGRVSAGVIATHYI
jgi:hypothetical protein